jgi:hypothetical protein
MDPSPTLDLALVLALSGATQGSSLPRPVDCREGVWISRAEIAELPTGGPAWEALLAEASRPLDTPLIRERNDDADIQIMAKALVHARTGETRFREEVLEGIRAAIGSEAGGDVLSLGRNLPGYVIAADLVGLPEDLERDFRAWLARVRSDELEGRTLVETHELRPNNWGTHAGGARVVIARYLEDWEDLERAAAVFKGWLGERSSYAGFEYGALDWQFDPANPVGINPAGATKDGHSIDGVLPDDQRRGGPFSWPPARVNYVYEALQGALLQAVVLHRAGYDAWAWGDRALLRAFRWLDEEADHRAVGDDTWQPHVINAAYQVLLKAPVPARAGKNVGWTDWTCRPGKRVER